MTLKRRLWVAAAVCLLLLVVGESSALAQAQTHTVQPGETLMRIAVRYGVTVEQLASINGIVNPDLIYVGQTLTILGPGGVSSATGSQTYEVQQGDTLFRIAQRFETTVDNLAALNGIANPDVLYVGQMLVISPATSAPATTTTETTSTTTVTETITHSVQSGETLSLIALRHGSTIQEIALLNGLTNPNLIFPGMNLLIPVTPSASEVAEASSATATPSPTTESPATFPTSTWDPAWDNSSPLIPTWTPSPTLIPSPTLTPADIVPASSFNRLANPGFEGSVRAVRFGEINVFEEWQPFYCDGTTVPGGCPALRIGAGNPPGLMMGRPEYKPTNIGNRVHSGDTAQQWFCFFRTCRAGVYQTFDTTPGAICEVGAYVQSWSTGNADITGWRSELNSEGDRANSTWQIMVDTDGSVSPFVEDLIVSAQFSYEPEPSEGYNREHGGHGVYDQYAPISFTFIATGDRATVFFQDTRLWPFPNNDSYIDDAWARCTH